MKRNIAQQTIWEFLDTLKIIHSDTTDVYWINVISNYNLGSQTLLLASDDLKRPELPSVLSLNQNVPNPFNPATSISYTLPNDYENVDLTVYNLRGAKVRVLRKGPAKAGYHTVYWNGLDEKGRYLSSGVYFYRLVINDFVLTRKMIILK